MYKLKIKLIHIFKYIMFDSQKLEFNNFVNSFLHGIYVFTDDTCSLCNEYKETISNINNSYLYFVEVSTNRQREYLYKLLDRQAFPMTACFKNNKLVYVRLGKLFELQLEEIFASLKEFGDKPLSSNDIADLIKKEQTKCLLSYYIFSNDCTNIIKEKIFNNAIKQNELPFDVDSLCPNLNLEQRLHLLEYTLNNAKLVLFKNNSNLFSDLGRSLVIHFTALHSNDENFKLDIRNIKEILKEDINDTNNSN